MHDIRFIREQTEAFDHALGRRGLAPLGETLKALDAQVRKAKTDLQDAEARKNAASKDIGKAMGQGDSETAERLKAEVADLKSRMPDMEQAVRDLETALKDELDVIPNLPAADVPDGADEHGNVEVSVWGDKPAFDFAPKEHADIAPALGMDFETGALLSGARFTFLRGHMARLHRALGQFMLDHQTQHNGYTECAPPVLVKDEAMYGTDKLPKFAEDSFETSIQTVGIESLFRTMRAVARERGMEEITFKVGGDDVDVDFLERIIQTGKNDRRRWLIPTSEVPLTASVMGQILDDAQLPIRLTALTQCFRSEAGAAGRDTRGFIRQHQFEKCELVSITRPEDSEAEHQRMLKAAQSVLEALGLPYRTMLLCTGDMGFGARLTYDLEVWLPGQSAYREISSCSNTGDFQARRMNARYRPADDSGGSKKPEFVHTLNGSGLAVGRTLVAVIENYQQADGSVIVPPALAPYMGGVEILRP